MSAVKAYVRKPSLLAKQLQDLYSLRNALTGVIRALEHYVQPPVKDRAPKRRSP